MARDIIAWGNISEPFLNNLKTEASCCNLVFLLMVDQEDDHLIPYGNHELRAATEFYPIHPKIKLYAV